MKNYLCANHHHFRSQDPRCPYPGCTAEVRPTAVNPLHGEPAPDFKRLPLLPEEERLAPVVKHRIRWWAYVDGKRTPRSSGMKGGQFGWDATCDPCEWDSRTGGATMGSVDRMVQEHKRG